MFFFKQIGILFNQIDINGRTFPIRLIVLKTDTAFVIDTHDDSFCRSHPILRRAIIAWIAFWNVKKKTYFLTMSLLSDTKGIIVRNQRFKKNMLQNRVKVIDK